MQKLLMLWSQPCPSSDPQLTIVLSSTDMPSASGVEVRALAARCR